MNLSTLEADIANWLARDDLTDQISGFIRLAQSSFNRDLRTRQMVKEATLSPVSGHVALPDDYLEVVTLESDTNPRQILQFLSVEEFKSRYGQSVAGPHVHYTTIGDSMRLAPDSPNDVILTYYAQLAPLVEPEDTNWILTSHYDAYLYGCLLVAAPYLMNDQRIPVWGQMLERALQGIRRDEQRAAYSGGPIQSQVIFSEGRF